MDHSTCHNGRMVTDELDNLKLCRLPHESYSSNLSPCDFWLFGMLKQKIKDWVFLAIEEIFTRYGTSWPWKICSPSSSIGLNDVNMSLSMRENITQNNFKRSSESLSHGEIRGVGNCLTTYKFPVWYTSHPLSLVFNFAFPRLGRQHCFKIGTGSQNHRSICYMVAFFQMFYNIYFASPRLERQHYFGPSHFRMYEMGSSALEVRIDDCSAALSRNGNDDIANVGQCLLYFLI
jgi:hypothetical protein